jgi:glycosyltransferase involved in cell wall biosynthesis
MSGMPRIIYLSSGMASTVSGGIKMAYRHTEALCDAGFSAVVATPDGMLPDWFETTTGVIKLVDAQPTDVLVFPENDHGLLRHFAAWQTPKVVFCQNPFVMHQGLAGAASYSAFGVSHLIGVSESVLQYCRRRVPDLNLAHVPPFVDHTRFYPQSQKRLQIAFTPRKRPMEAGCLRDLFQATLPEFRQVPWIPIAGASEAQVAAIMRESAIFLSLQRLEACPLTGLEAMASGCLVAGFTGQGGAEYATTWNGFWAAEDDMWGCLEQLTQAVKLARGETPEFLARVNEGIATSRRYSREAATHKLVNFWRGRLAE